MDDNAINNVNNKENNTRQKTSANYVNNSLFSSTKTKNLAISCNRDNTSLKNHL